MWICVFPSTTLMWTEICLSWSTFTLLCATMVCGRGWHSTRGPCLDENQGHWGYIHSWCPRFFGGVVTCNRESQNDMNALLLCVQSRCLMCYFHTYKQRRFFFFKSVNWNIPSMGSRQYIKLHIKTVSHSSVLSWTNNLKKSCISFQDKNRFEIKAVTDLPDATTVLAQRVFSILRLSWICGSVSSYRRHEKGKNIAS